MKRSVRAIIGEVMHPAGIMTITCRDSGHVKEYIGCDIPSISGCTADVPIYEDEAELTERFIGKDQEPLVLLRRCAYDLPNIYLLEDVRYYIEFEPCDKDQGITGPLTVLRRADADVEEVPIEGRTIYAVRFAGYVGRGTFDVCIGGIGYEIPFEVRCSKIEYINQYPQMMADISEYLSSLLLHSESPLSMRYAIGDDPSMTYYEDFILIEYIFSRMDIEGAFSIVRNNIHRDLITERTESHCCDAYDVDPGSLYEMSSGGRIIPFDGGSIGGRYEFTVTINNEHRETFDTLENRMVKDLLVTMDRMLEDMVPFSPEGCVKASINMKRDKLGAMLSEPWLRDVGRLDRIPFGLNVLKATGGYSDMFEMYMILESSMEFNVEDGRFLLDGNTNKVPQTYEYWCYIRILKALCELSGRPMIYERMIQKRWGLSIRGKDPITFEMGHRFNDISIDLYYNHGISRGDDGLRSYSVALRPDFTLVVRDGPRRRVINFDSKYKLQLDPDVPTDDDDPISTICWRADIYKMHTYRDAIYSCWGAYVLYPGTVSNWYSKTYMRDIRDEDIPAVGAIPLVPGKDDGGRFKMILSKILDLVIDIERRELLIDYIN